MIKNVYIKNAVYLENGFNKIADRSTDKISCMCITTLEKLFEGITGKRDIPIFFGSAFSSLKSLHEFNIVYENRGALAVNPSLFPNAVLNSPSCRAGIHHKITSPIYNISNGLYSGIDALELAFLYITNCQLENAVVCVAEEESEFAEKAGNKKNIDACGAVYLTSEKSDSNSRSFSKKFIFKNNGSDNDINQSTDTIKMIYDLINNN